MSTADKPTIPGKPKGKPHIVATYDYRDEIGDLLFQVVRYEPKGFKQRRPDGNGDWTWSVKGVRVVPYRLRELLAEPKRPVIVVEGEKDADNLARIGALATCNAGGTGKWTSEYSKFLRGRTVFIIADNDDAGRNHSQQVAQSLQGIAESVRIVELPGLPDKGDVSDWIAVGGTNEELMRLAEAAPVEKPKKKTGPGPCSKLNLEEIPHALASLKRLFLRHYYFSDENVIDLVLGVVAGNHFDSDPIWLHLISPPSGGKTELLYSIFDCEQTYFLSDFTPAALISGYKDDPKHDTT
jgi:hypothetical protein